MKNKTAQHKYSVLVIDDQKNWREVITDILDDEFKVVNASSYDEALEKIREQNPPFHVVVTDMRLVDEEAGNEDGLKLVEYLNQRGDETQTIVLTGYATISTAKRALSKLAVHEYLEKFSSESSPFDINGFQKIVYQAAENAEQKRPNGITDIHQNILLLESNSNWRKKLKESISENGYKVNAPNIDEKLNLYLKNDLDKYALIIIEEALSTEETLDNIHHLHPNARIVILTTQNIDPIFKAMRNYPVLSAFNIRDKNFNSIALQEFIHSALAYGAIKYISTEIEEFDNQSLQTYPNKSHIYDLISGKTYNIKLSIQDTPLIGTTPIWLSPQKEKNGKIQLHIAIHAKQININPGTDNHWNIFLSRQEKSFKFSITPQSLGKNEIIVEIDQNHRWLARITIEVNVTSNY